MRLIDADLLIEKAKQDGAYDYVSAEEIANAPTIDICKDCDCRRVAIEALQQEPVKHGKWKYYNYSDINNPYVGWYECSVCKQHEHIEHKFCPNCGAKMERGEP